MQEEEEETGNWFGEKNGVSCCFSTSITNPSDIPTWNNMAAVKSNILKRWDTAPAGVRICCIKFVQKVVQVQTPAVIDPRVRDTFLIVFIDKPYDIDMLYQRPDKNEISIALVPRDHPLLQTTRLEPESSGLLDRLLDVFHQERYMLSKDMSMGTDLTPKQRCHLHLCHSQLCRRSTSHPSTRL